MIGGDLGLQFDVLGLLVFVEVEESVGRGLGAQERVRGIASFGLFVPGAKVDYVGYTGEHRSFDSGVCDAGVEAAAALLGGGRVTFESIEPAVYECAAFVEGYL